MRIRFIRGTCLGGIGNDAAPGDERDLPEGQAVQLVAQGRAEPIPEASPMAKAMSEALAPVTSDPTADKDQLAATPETTLPRKKRP